MCNFLEMNGRIYFINISYLILNMLTTYIPYILTTGKKLSRVLILGGQLWFVYAIRSSLAKNLKTFSKKWETLTATWCFWWRKLTFLFNNGYWISINNLFNRLLRIIYRLNLHMKLTITSLLKIWEVENHTMTAEIISRKI